MLVKYAAETVMTLSLFLSRVWCRPAEVVCDGGRREGDKWFDGCQWCVCQGSGTVCSTSTCTHHAPQTVACHNVGSSWWDGCYVCTCHPESIECSPDQACVTLMRSDRYQACLTPSDDRCICGIDGVPSCSAEVIDKHAHPGVAEELINTVSSSPGDLHFTNLRTVNTRTHHSSGVNHQNTQEQNAKTNAPDDSQYRKPESHTFQLDSKDRPILIVDPTTLADHYTNEVLSLARNIESREYYSRTESHSFGTLSNQESNTDAESAADHGEIPVRTHSQTTADNASPALLVVSVNDCRWGPRWYGGSLRCYCGLENSIICGEPSFVTARIDSFRLKHAACQQGQTWEDDSCRVCQCQINGLALCWHSPSCLLPFIIKPLSDIDTKTDFEIRGDGHYSVAYVDDISRVTESIDSDTSSGMVDERDSTGDGSGDVKFHSVTASWAEGNDNHTEVGQDKSTVDLSIDSINVTTILVDFNKNPGTSDSLKIDNSENNGEHKSQYAESNTTYTDKQTSEYKDSDDKGTTEMTVRECKPRSRWIDGCKRCECDSAGKKNCDESRCPKVMDPNMETSKSSPDCGDKQHIRPVQCPPVISSPTRDRPVDLDMTFNKSNLCGRFNPGEMYWEECNMCLCTSYGPKCTAKNCI